MYKRKEIGKTSQAMRIGFFTSVDGWGGSEMYLRSLITNIHSMGHEVVLFGVEGTNLFADAKGAGIKCFAWKRSKGCTGSQASIGKPLESHSRLPFHQKLRRWLVKVLPCEVKLFLHKCIELANLWRLFRREPVDVMHVNVNEYEVAGIVCSLCSIPCLAMCCLFPDNEEGLLKGWLIRFTSKFYTIVASKSQTCINAWREYCNLPATKCRFIWNGVDLTKFGYKEREIVPAGRPFRILAVGRLNPMKGLDVLIRAMSMLRDQNAILWIAGHGIEKKTLARLVADLNLSSRVEFLGHVEDVVDLYQQADCTVLASVTKESFGQTLIEAMACGSPLITSDMGPFLEINVHNTTGLVVPKGDVSSLAKAIQEMMQDEGSRTQMGRHARERAEKLFSLDHMIEETMNLYTSIVETPKSTSRRGQEHGRIAGVVL